MKHEITYEIEVVVRKRRLGLVPALRHVGEKCKNIKFLQLR